PFFVATQFTGIDGKYVPIAESIRGFKEILEGKHDEVPERAFFMKGSIDEVVADSGGAKAKEDDSDEPEAVNETEATDSGSGSDSDSDSDSDDDDDDDGDGDRAGDDAGE